MIILTPKYYVHYTVHNYILICTIRPAHRGGGFDRTPPPPWRFRWFIDSNCMFIRNFPPAMPYDFVRIFYFFFVFFLRQVFRLIIFYRQAGPFQNFNRSQVMVIGISVSFSDPVRPPGGGVGRPKHPKIPPPQKCSWGLKTPTNQKLGGGGGGGGEIIFSLLNNFFQKCS